MLLRPLIPLPGAVHASPGKAGAGRHQKKNPSLPLTYLKRACLLALIFTLTSLISISLRPWEAEAGDALWPPRARKWLRALTYIDEDPADFGVKTTAEEKALLEEFRPRIFIAPGGNIPVDFYKFYLPETLVRDEAGAAIKKHPRRSFLKSIERRAGYYLDYEGPENPCERDACDNYIAAGYGRVYREKARFRTNNGIQEKPVIVLKYNFAFTYSGAPAELGWLKELTLSLLMDPAKIHELDIHGAVHVILNESKRPIVLLLAQHNHFRSYVFGKNLKALPDDKRVKICFALRSNEPYPCPALAVPVSRRTVGNPVNISYVIDGRGRPFLSGGDMVFGPKAGGREVSYALKFLPSKDPLYVSWIPLGNKEKILFFNSYYRKGPPGMELNTWPELKKYSDIMQFWYLKEGNTENAAFMKGAFRSFTDVDFKSVLKRNGRRLYDDIQAARPEAKDMVGK
ncbi:MAG: hypothetical protein ACE5DW_06770 [Thermodesulfobacteriota bacterium]